VRDFVIEARFFNPYGVSEHAWDYGFLFRDTGGNKQYRLVVSSNSRWDLFLVDGDPNVAALEYGYVENFDITVNGSNRIRLVAKDTSVYFFVNDKYVATLNVSKKLDSGDIYVATGIYGGHTINGKFTRYEGFTVWSLQ
jgi:hypothetical protein